MENLKNKLMAALKNLDDSDLIWIHNEVASMENRMDDIIYIMDEFDDVANDFSPHELATKIFYGDFCPQNKYFMFNGYGNFKSTDYPVRDWIFIEDIADVIAETGNDFEQSEISEVLKEVE